MWQPPGAPAAAPPAAAQPASGAHSKDPSAYAATAPPPTNEEFDRLHQQNQPAPIPGTYAPPPMPAPSAPPPPVAAAAPAGPTVSDPSLRVLAGFLVSYETTELGVFWPIYQGQNIVGRKGAAPGLDIEIDHPTTSSRHAVIHATARPGKLRVEDPGSTNGTFLGEHMIEKNKSHDLRDGEAVRFGGFNVIVKII
jgi:pSer/pThr/pTyr-binding forkhead associated (FHA) protein